MAYDTAAICAEGHLITESIELKPDRDRKFCKECGSQVLKKCLKCNSKIEGLSFIVRSVGYAEQKVYDLSFDFKIPSFCGGCGEPHPWTKKAMNEIEELVNLQEKLNKTEKKVLSRGIFDIIKNKDAKAAYQKIRNILPKMSKEHYEKIEEFFIKFGAEYLTRMSK